MKTVRRRRTAAAARLRKRVHAYLATHARVDCGERDPAVLDVDHRRDKSANVGALVHLGAPWGAVAAEVEKCEVRCANCHRRRTAAEQSHYRVAVGTMEVVPTP